MPADSISTQHLAALTQANQLFMDGKTAQAEAVLTRALQRSPSDAALNRSMAQMLLFRGDTARALYFAERLVASAPQSADALMMLANVQATAGKGQLADQTAIRALQVNPDNLEARLAEIQRLYMDYRLHEMMARCQDGLRLYPNQAELSINLSNALLMMGRGDDAVAALRSALAADPSNHALSTAICAAMNYSHSASPADVFAAHVNYGRVLAGMMLPRTPRPPENRDPQRRIRVGFQSPDLKTHPVAVFLGAILPHLDRSQIEPVAYYTGLVEDDVSRRLRPKFALWRHFTGVREQDMAALIASDRIDILIELDGHFATHRLPSCHLKPAPVIATYLGYPNTTGVPAIDYRIVDSLTDPAPGADRLAVEKLVRLDPCFLCYQPPEDAPAIDPTPPVRRAGAGGITFGSFNSLQKINDRLIRAWKQVVEAVPGSRLLLKNNALRHAELRKITVERFAAQGFPTDRLEVMPPTASVAQHLAVYNQVDIALDAFPYCGTTTTCESLLMGVPVVSLASPPQPEGMHAGRVGVSLLTNAGLPDLLADTAERYVDLAARLAVDVDRLTRYRHALRAQLLASTVCDAPAFGRRFSDALRTMWRAHCATK